MMKKKASRNKRAPWKLLLTACLLSNGFVSENLEGYSSSESSRALNWQPVDPIQINHALTELLKINPKLAFPEIAKRSISARNASYAPAYSLLENTPLILARERVNTPSPLQQHTPNYASSEQELKTQSIEPSQKPVSLPSKNNELTLALETEAKSSTATESIETSPPAAPTPAKLKIQTELSPSKTDQTKKPSRRVLLTPAGQEYLLTSQESLNLDHTLDTLIAQGANELDAPAILTATDQTPNDEEQKRTILIRFNNISIVEYIRYLSRVTNKNFIFDENELLFNVTIVSEEPTTIDDVLVALIQVLRIHGLNLIQNGDDFIIYQNPAVRGISKVEAETMPETFRGTSEIVTRVFSLNTLDATDAAVLVKSILSDTAIVQPMPKTNSLVVTDFTVNTDRVSTLLKSMDSPQSGLTVGQYAVRNTDLDALVQVAQQVMQPIAQGQTLMFVPQQSSDSIFIISTPFLLERVIPILQRLDQNSATTGVYDLRDVEFRSFNDWKRGLYSGTAGGAPEKLRRGAHPGEAGRTLPTGAQKAAIYGPGGVPFGSQIKSIYGSDGTPIGNVNYEPDGTPIGVPGGTPGTPIYGPDRKPIGTLGNIIYGPDGSPRGNVLYGPDGKPLHISGVPVYGPDGTSVGTLKGNTLYGPDGTPLHIEGEGLIEGTGVYAPNDPALRQGIEESGQGNELPQGQWRIDPNGGWVYPLKAKGNQPPNGIWTTDGNGNWIFQENPNGTPGGIPQDLLNTGSGLRTGLTRVEELQKANKEGRVIDLDRDPLPAPRGRWTKDANGNWVFQLDPGESITSTQLTRFARLNPQLPVGFVEQTKFYIHKLQFRKGDMVQAAIQQIGASLSQTGDTNAALLATINSVQWLEESNSLVVAGPPVQIEKVRELILEIDVPLRQVFIEMLILDTSVDDSLNYGVNWGSKFGGGDTAGAQGFVTGGTPFKNALGIGGRGRAAGTTGSLIPPTPDASPLAGFEQGFTLGIIGRTIVNKCLGEFSSIGALVEALHLLGTSNIILNPKIVTEDNVAAEVFVGINTRFLTQSISNDQGSIVTSNFEFRDVGTRMKVTPMLGPTNIITLEIEEEVSSISPQGSSGSNTAGLANLDPGPTTSKSNTKTRVHLPDGFFLILSGNIHDDYRWTRNNVPCLGGIPYLGAAFSHVRKTDTKRNLMIFIRPKLIDTEEEMINITRHQQDVWKYKNRVTPMWKTETEGALEWGNVKGRSCCGPKCNWEYTNEPVQ